MLIKWKETVRERRPLNLEDMDQSLVKAKSKWKEKVYLEISNQTETSMTLETKEKRKEK